MIASSKKQKILGLLEAQIPYVEPSLVFSNPFELLIAVMLSAQCTDVRVNQVTAPLFEKYPTPASFICLSQPVLAEQIKSCGLYRNKSKHIIATAKLLMERYRGRVPDNLTDLMALPGVGRKTANVILAQAFGQPAMPVDTHVFRVSRRLGLTRGTTTLHVEKDLLALLPRDQMNMWHLRLIHFGRTVCLARSPRCGDCVVQKHCFFYNADEAGRKGM